MKTLAVFYFVVCVLCFSFFLRIDNSPGFCLAGVISLIHAIEIYPQEVEDSIFDD